MEDKARDYQISKRQITVNRRYNLYDIKSNLNKNGVKSIWNQTLLFYALMQRCRK